METTGWDYGWSWTAGAMTSTLADLKRYAPALATGRGLLSPRTQKARLKFVSTGTSGIGYGLGIVNYAGLLGHDGAVPGYDTWTFHAPTTGATLILLGNTAVELNATKNKAPSSLFDLATCLGEIAAGETCG